MAGDGIGAKATGTARKEREAKLQMADRPRRIAPVSVTVDWYKNKLSEYMDTFSLQEADISIQSVSQLREHFPQVQCNN